MVKKMEERLQKEIVQPRLSMTTFQGLFWTLMQIISSDSFNFILQLQYDSVALQLIRTFCYTRSESIRCRIIAYIITTGLWS